MQRLNIKKGFSLVEVICSLFIFSIVSLSFYYSYSYSLKLREYNKKMSGYLYYFNGIKEYMEEESYDDISLLKSENLIYLQNEYISFDFLENDQLMDKFKKENKGEYPYIKLNIEGNEILTIKIVMKVKILNKEYSLESEIYKGDYKT
ncbi:MAG: prepilin-type N-terminal cleavage/methylation domain-containing protein [Clostridiaceae bacterium]